jgi:hypothetical protein
MAGAGGGGGGQREGNVMKDWRTGGGQGSRVSLKRKTCQEPGARSEDAYTCARIKAPETRPISLPPSSGRLLVRDITYAGSPPGLRAAQFLHRVKERALPSADFPLCAPPFRPRGGRAYGDESSRLRHFP